MLPGAQHKRKKWHFNLLRTLGFVALFLLILVWAVGLWTLYSPSLPDLLWGDPERSLERNVVLRGRAKHAPAALGVGVAATYPLQLHGKFEPKRKGMLMIKEVESGLKWGHQALTIPLDRNITDFRAPTCRAVDYDLRKLKETISVIIIFCDEPKFNLLRTIHSVLNRTPPEMLEEILLVDDKSTVPYIRPDGNHFLEDYIRQLPKVRLLRNPSRTGIVGARLLGISSAKASIFVMLDSHVEVGYDWAEPLAFRIAEDPNRIVMPLIDGIEPFSYEVTSGGIGCVLGILWRMVEHSFPPSERNIERMDKQPTDYVTSPTMAGGIFAANRDTFLKMGGYDPGITFWGAENIELSFRWWQCGGTIECSECSRVAHIFGGYRGYDAMDGASVTHNRLRIAAVWMDEFSDFVWKMMGRPPDDDLDVSAQKALRKRLKCKPFRWFLTNIWPESDIIKLPRDVPFFGELNNLKAELCMVDRNGVYLTECRNYLEMVYFKRPGRITPQGNEERCLTVEDGKLEFSICHEDRRDSQRFIYHNETKQLINNGDTCLDEGDSRQVVLKPCDINIDSQKWSWEEYKFEDKLPWEYERGAAEGSDAN